MTLLLLFFFVPVFVFAQSPEVQTDNEAATRDFGETIANVNLTDATIEAQSDADITISFNLINADPVPHFDIRYGAELILTATSGQQNIVDNYVPAETITLEANQTLTKEFIYPIKNIPSGTYSVWVTARTEGGVVLGLGNAGMVNITNQESLEILADSCYLTIEGVEDRYSLRQGVDVSGNEEILLTCTVRNPGSAKTVRANFDTYTRTIFGDTTDQNFTDTNTFSFTAGEEKSMTLSIPKATLPQAYDVVITFLDNATQQVISNKLTAHYVLQGESATIQKVDFTQNTFQAGEEISLNLSWTGSADGFPGSRAGTSSNAAITTEVKLIDRYGYVCAMETRQGVTEQSLVLSITPSIECVDQTVVVNLVGASGQVLDSKSLKVPLVLSNASPATPTVPEASGTSKFVALFLSVLSLIALLAAFFFYRQRQTISESSQE